MLPLPKLFDATRVPDIADGIKFQIIPGGDPLVDQIISGTGLSGLVGATAFISATAPTVITTTIVVDVSFTFGVSTATITTTTVVPAAISEAIIAGAATGGIILLVIALGIVADLQSKAQAERNLEKQRDAIDKLNNQIDELNKNEFILREKLQNHLDDQEKLLHQKVTNLRNYTNAYQVKHGDGLSKIALANGISLSELLNANTQFSKELLYNQNLEFGIAHQFGRNPNLIFPGEYINIPNNPNSQINQNSNVYSNKQFNIPPALAKELGLPMKLEIAPELTPKAKLSDHSQLIEILISSSIYDTYQGKILPIEETNFLKLLQDGFIAIQSAKLNTDSTDLLQNIIESLQNTLSTLTDEQYQNLIEGIIDHNYTYRWLNPQGLIINWILDDMLVQTQGKVANISDYLNRSLAQVIKGSFTDEEEVTALGSFSEIAIGIAAGAYGVDLPLDVRDVSGDITKGYYFDATLGVLFMIPLVGALKGVKLIFKYIDYPKFKKAINGINWSSLKKTLHFFQESSKVFPTGNFNLNSLPNGETLTKNLSTAIDAKKPESFHAHHIIPGGNYTNRSKDIQLKLKELRNKLLEFEIDINDANNGVFLPGKDGLHPTAINHNKIHTNKYFENLHVKISELSSKEQILEKLAEIRYECLTGKIVY